MLTYYKFTTGFVIRHRVGDMLGFHQSSHETSYIQLYKTNSGDVPSFLCKRILGDGSCFAHYFRKHKSGTLVITDELSLNHFFSDSQVSSRLPVLYDRTSCREKSVPIFCAKDTGISQPQHKVGIPIDGYIEDEIFFPSSPPSHVNCWSSLDEMLSSESLLLSLLVYVSQLSNPFRRRIFDPGGQVCGCLD